MSKKPSFIKKIAPYLLGTFFALNLGLSLFLVIKVNYKSKVGYVRMDNVIQALFIDVQNKNKDFFQREHSKIKENEKKYEKLKKEIDLKKNRAQNSSKSVDNKKLKELKKTIESDYKALKETIQRTVSKELVARLKEVPEAIEAVRKKHGYDIIFHQAISASFILDNSPLPSNAEYREIGTFNKKIDMTKEVLDKLGLEEPKLKK